jgi:K(+)-stimulated pyrophosphate-energized sodium pump
MAADLFESYAVTLVAALILGKAAFGSEGLIFPLVVPAIGGADRVIGSSHPPAPSTATG